MRAEPETSAPWSQPVSFSPLLAADDPLANYWLRQVTVRLRREIAWLWHERGQGGAGQVGESWPANRGGALPAFADELQETLDLTRFFANKQHFFATDLTAQYLSDQLRVDPPFSPDPPRGSLSWVVVSLGLDRLGTFLLALGTSAALDHAMGSVIAACLNHANKVQPSLALAQKLWDDPQEVLAAADPAHPLFRRGLLHGAPSGHSEGVRPDEIGWETPLSVPPMVANQMLFPTAALPPALVLIESDSAEDEPLDDTARLVAARTVSAQANDLQIVPVRGRRGSARRQVVAGISALNGRPVVEFRAAYHLLGSPRYLEALGTLCWLRGVDLFIDEDLLTALSAQRESSQGGGMGRYPAGALPPLALPIVLYLGISERSQLPRLPARHWLPLVDVPEFTYAERLAFWQRGLARWTSEPHGQPLAKEIAEASRRFRFGKEALSGVLAGLQASPVPPTAETLMAACRAEVDLDIGELAQKVIPRFEDEHLILPPREMRAFDEVAQAMRSLTEVHYVWGTAQAWNESGIAALFAGPPGTGKTMAAEILALRLGLPIYRIDLSQVVNKYIGETEKNLKHLFDAADDSDMILFFDEADALFGKRTEVKDAHDRYANLEINYLLERMERFKGMAILATNRKKDLDEAFLRRLRYIVDFPLPGEEQRKRIWRQVTPKAVDASAVDINFLSRQFPLAGGSIRSVIFNACLQSAGQDAPPDSRPRLSMPAVLVAVKREYDKLNRTISLETFGTYGEMIRQLDNEDDRP